MSDHARVYLARDKRNRQFLNVKCADNASSAKNFGKGALFGTKNLEVVEMVEVAAMDAATAELRADREEFRSIIAGVQGALADAGDVLAMREDGDYGASVREIVEQRDKLRAENEKLKAAISEAKDA